MEKDDGIVRRFLFSVVVRPLMFVVVAAVFWGTVMLATWIVSALRRGIAETWQGVLPAPDDLWSTANFVLPLLALVIWMVAAAGWVQRRARPQIVNERR